MAKKNGGVEITLTDKDIEQIWNMVEPELQKRADAGMASIPVEENPGTLAKRDRNGRPVVLIALRTPGGLSAQAKHGYLTRAAASQGFDVTRYSDIGG